MRTLGALLLDDRPVAANGHRPAETPCSLRSVANRPLAVHALQALVRAGAERVVVAGEGAIAHPLRHALLDAAPAQLELEFHELPEDGGGGLAALVDATRLAGDECLVLHTGDYLFCGDLDELTTRMVDEELDAILLVDRPCDGNGNGAAVHPAGAPPRRFAGVHLLRGTSAQRALELRALRGLEATLERLQELLAAGGARVHTALADRAWRYVDTPDALLEANRLALDRIEHQVPAAAFASSRVQGRVLVDPTAKIEDSLIRGPAVVGAGARVVGSYVGPYSTIGDGVVLDGVEVEHSIVHAGSTVRHVGVRLESSVIGPASVVERQFALPAAMQLAIGAGARVCVT